MIKVREVTKSFGRITAVSQVDFTVGRQEIFGVVGPDGAGKTTLLRMVCGLITQSRGIYTFLVRTFQKKQVSFRVYAPRFSLYPDLTVMENINFSVGYTD